MSVNKMGRYISKEKLEQIFEAFNNLKIDYYFLMDSERTRNVNIRYLSGHIEDAAIILDIKNQETILIPWDVNLAQDMAEVSKIINWIELYPSVRGAKLYSAVLRDVIQENKDTNPTVALSYYTPVGVANLFKEELSNATFVTNMALYDKIIDQERAVKTKTELKIFKEAFEQTKILRKRIVEFAAEKDKFTEKELALFVELEARKLGAEKQSFEAIVAGKSRSWQIHAYPRASEKHIFNEDGLALIDFGIQWKGLATDVTIPFIFGSLTAEKKKVRDTLEKAYNLALDTVAEGDPTWKTHETVSNFLNEHGYSFPHALGHGIGLEVHDAPYIGRKPKTKDDPEFYFERGMVFTIEPGIYVKNLGGLRIENDFILNENGKLQCMTDADFVHIA